MKKIIDSLIDNNTTFSLMLGLCSLLAMTTTFELAYTAGFFVLIVLLFSNVIISFVRKIVRDNMKVLISIIITGILVMILELIISGFIPDLYNAFGIYLPLIALNALVLDRAVRTASKSKVITTIKDSLVIGIHFLIIISLIGLVRELLGNNTITLMNHLSSLTGYRAVYKVFPENNILPINVLSNPAGAFMILGLFMAILNLVRNRKVDKNGSN